MSSPFHNIAHREDKERKIPKESNSTIQNDQLLWKSFRNGSESAFVEIYNRYFQMLYEYGRQFSQDSEIVKDYVQDMFVTMRKKRFKLPQVRSIKAYLLKCLRNKIIFELKKLGKKQFVDVTSCHLSFHIVPSHENVLINRQFNDSQIKQIHMTLSRLSPRKREAIYYFYYNNLSYEEIKEVMGFGSTRAARNLIYRAISEIRKTFDPHK